MNYRLKTCSGNDFFELLEKCVKFRIPSQMKKILTVNLCNNALALSGDLPQTIKEIESFMRVGFSVKLLKENDTMADYLGIWEDNQQGFQLMSGQKRMISFLFEYCRELYPFREETKTTQNVLPTALVPIVSPSHYIPSSLPSQGLFVCHIFLLNIF